MIRHARYNLALVALTLVSLTIAAQFTPNAPADEKQPAKDATDAAVEANAAPNATGFNLTQPSLDNVIGSGAFDSSQPSEIANDSGIPAFDPLPTPSNAPDSGKTSPKGFLPPFDTGVSGQPNSPPNNAPTPWPDSARPASAHAAQTVTIQYTTRRPETVKFRTPDGKTAEAVRYVAETQSVEINVAEDLNKLDLPPEGKRIAVLTVTAARHHGLLEKLKAAKTPAEKEAATLAVRENYTEHYAIETWWREQKLAELETRLQELRAQVTQRQESEEKYVMAAMTIAELWADGIGITPPTPSHVPVGVPAQTMPGPSSYSQPNIGLYIPSPSLRATPQAGQPKPRVSQ